MIQVIEQYKRQILNICRNNFLGGENVASELLESGNTGKYLKDNKDKIINFVESLDKEDDFIGMKDGILDKYEVGTWGTNNDEALKEILTTLNLGNMKLSDGINMNLLIQKIKEFGGEVNKVVLKTRADVEEHKDMTNVGEKHNESETKENISKNKNKILWADWLSKDGSFGDYMKIPGIRNLLRNTDSDELRDIKQKLDKVVERNKEGDVEFFDSILFGDNYSKEMRKILGDKYKEDGYFDTKEASSLYGAIRAHLNTQDKISSLPPEEQMKLMFDFDKNGKIELPVNANVGEAQMYAQTFESINSRDADALVQNLGFGNLADLNSKMQNNLFATRERFQRALLSAIEGGFTPAELIFPGKMNDIAKSLVENREGIKDRVDKLVDTWRVDFFGPTNQKNRVENGEREITSQEKSTFVQKLKDALLPAALGISHLDNETTGGASYSARDTLGSLAPREMNNLNNILGDFLKVIDPDISVGAGPAGFGASLNLGLLKEFLSKYGVSITASLSNFVMPFLSGSYTYDRDIGEMESMFQDTIDSKVEPTIYGGVGSGVVSGGLILSKVDQTTAVGIEKMSKKMSTYLEGVGEDILSNKDSLDGGTEQDKQAYLEMKDMFKRNSEGMSKEEKNTYMYIFMEGFSRNFKNYLYKNSDTLEATNIGLGVLMITGFLPLPYITLGGEIKTQEFRKANSKGLDNAAQENTYREISLNSIGASIKKIVGGERFLSIPKKYAHIISDESGQLEFAEDLENSDNLLFGGVRAENIHIKEHATSEKMIRTIVVGKGVIGENGEYKNTTNKIDLSEIKGGILEKSGINESLGYEIEQFEAAKPITDTLDILISKNALSDKRTIGMMDLQRDIFSFRKNGNPSLDIVYDKYLFAIKHSGFKKYVIKKSGLGEFAEDKVNDLIQKSEGKNLTDTQKIFILQTMSNNFMKSRAFDVNMENGDYKLKKGNIASYDTKRDKLFDSMMSKELGGSMSSKVSFARKQWINQYGKNTEFQAVPADTSKGTLGLTANAYKNNVNGLLPLTGMFNVVGFDGEVAIASIDDMSVSDKESALKNIPKNTLNAYANQINSYGYKFDNNSVIKFIANGGDENIKIDMDTSFVKNVECLNDCLKVDIKISKEGEEINSIGVSSSGDIFVQKNNVIGLGVLAGGKLRREKEEDNEASKEAEKEAAKETEKEEAKETEKEEAKEAQKEASKEVEKEASKEAQKEAAREDKGPTTNPGNTGGTPPGPDTNPGDTGGTPIGPITNPGEITDGIMDDLENIIDDSIDVSETGGR